MAGIAEIISVLSSCQRGTGGRLDRDDARLLRLALQPLPMKGKAMPAKFDPPPAQPMTMSGNASAMANCSIASWPMTD